jgi:flavin reductase (DIM6/NTAB) family NADH-FMN oxidoreductase RutF
MLFDMATLDTDHRYKVLTATVTPRPIAWVTTVSEQGVVNAAPFSFFNVMGHEPPTVTLGLLRQAGGDFKDIIATGEFVINLVSEANAAAMNITCMDAPPEVDELACAGLTAVSSRHVAPPRIAESPVSFECRSMASLVRGPCQTLAIGYVLAVHVNDAFVLDPVRCYIDTPALGLVARMHGSGWHARSSDLFEMRRPTYSEWVARTQS